MSSIAIRACRCACYSKPYTRNISKRIVKSPKVYFIDSGLVCALSGLKQANQVSNTFKGALFESFILLNLLSYASAMDGELYYFRTQGGKEKEIDFVLEMNGKAIAIEVKYATRVGFRDAENLFFLKDLLPNFERGLVIYDGPDVLTLGENIYAVPWAAFSRAAIK